jgi:uncharacterized membrane protein YfcA
VVAEVVLVALAAFVAATIAGVSGFGGAVVLLPVLVAVFGARDAIVVLTVAQLVGNGSRVYFNRDDVDGLVVRRFAIGAVPLALAGGAVFATLPAGALTRALGAFMLAAVAWRHLHHRPATGFPPERFVGLGAAFGFLSAIVGSVGPVMAPFFLGYGLVKGAYIGTEAACTVLMHVTKLVAYGGGGVLNRSAALAGIGLAPVMVAGSWVGKRVLDRLPERAFALIIDAVLVVSGGVLLIQG